MLSSSLFWLLRGAIVCTSRTYWHQLPTYPLDLHCVLRHLATSSCRAFSVAAPRAWNWLPTERKLLRSTTTIRRQLKTFLPQSAYGHRKDWWLFCDAPSVLEWGCNTNDSVICGYSLQSSTKPEVHNVLQRRDSMVRGRHEHAQKLVKFGQSVFEICSRTET